MVSLIFLIKIKGFLNSNSFHTGGGDDTGMYFGFEMETKDGTLYFNSYKFTCLIELEGEKLDFFLNPMKLMCLLSSFYCLEIFT